MTKRTFRRGIGRPDEWGGRGDGKKKKKRPCSKEEIKVKKGGEELMGRESRGKPSISYLNSMSEKNC